MLISGEKETLALVAASEGATAHFEIFWDLKTSALVVRIVIDGVVNWVGFWLCFLELDVIEGDSSVQ